MWSAMRWSATVSASVAGIALLSLLIAFPTVMNEIATMEEELALHRSEFIAMSNEMWDDLLTQSTIIRHAQNIRRRSISGIRSRRQCWSFFNSYMRNITSTLILLYIFK